ncbi:hypothetical protein C8R47DRAFT_1080115 [Mycena vitilis]|nr:hypothetical protein C8R47DRAFT_1080115 [Mycena vitilis]
MPNPSFKWQLRQGHQLFIDNQAGLVASTFKFGMDPRSRPANSTSRTSASGGRGEHACDTLSTCQFIDWTKSIARACPAGILQYAQVQPKGVVAPCCDSSGCSAPSDPSNAPYTCDTSRTLYLCVNDGAAAESVEPKGNTICSGNFSGAANVPSGASAGKASQTGSNGSSQPIHRVLSTPQIIGTSGSSQPAHHVLSTPQIIGISVAVAVVLGTIILISKWIQSGGYLTRTCREGLTSFDVRESGFTSSLTGNARGTDYGIIQAEPEPGVRIVDITIDNYLFGKTQLLGPFAVLERYGRWFGTYLHGAAATREVGMEEISVR